jgi:hypothetical protein
MKRKNPHAVALGRKGASRRQRRSNAPRARTPSLAVRSAAGRKDRSRSERQAARKPLGDRARAGWATVRPVVRLAGRAPLLPLEPPQMIAGGAEADASRRSFLRRQLESKNNRDVGDEPREAT